MIMDIIFLILGIIFLLIFGYLYFLAIWGLIPEKKRKEKKKEAKHYKFAIIIPAHNEENVIRKTLESISGIDYPENLYEVFVIADNCIDTTAEIARKAGCCCLVRNDPENHGKGFALDWAFKQIIENGDHEAFVVLDADTIMEAGFLKALNKRISNGAKAIQGYYDVLHPERSPSGGLSYLGFIISRNLKYKGRTRLGWTTNILGNGMCFTRDVIECFGYPATSIVEDIEYEMILHLNGVRVVFAPEARVFAEIPETFEGSTNQRGRWDIGKFKVRNKYLHKLIKEGFKQKDISYFDSAMELLIPPFSLFVILVLSLYVLFFIFNFKGITINFFLWTGIVASLFFYILSGLLLARASFKIYLSLLYTPYFLFLRLVNVLIKKRKKKHITWFKTERENKKMRSSKNSTE